jgi:glycosyltransferase involved in cell wall biosynthesis
MKLFFFGADDSWSGLCESGFHRRNTNVLKAFVENKQITKVYIVKRIPKNKWFTHWKQRSKHPKAVDIQYCSLLPDKHFKYFNQLMARLMVLVQTRTYPAQNDIIWCYWPRGFLNAKYLNRKGQWIFDADHNIIEDPNIENNQLEEQNKLLTEIAFYPRLEAVVSSARSMLIWFKNKNSKLKLYRVRNGVDLQRFNDSDSKNNDRSKNIIGYCGTLSKWIRWDWLLKIIDELPQYTFRFIGQAYKDDNYLALSGKKNVELLGFKSAQETPDLIKSFDVAIGLYQEHPALDVDSMKLYEYLAADVPIVVNKYHAFLKEDFNQLLLIATSYKEFKHLILEAINKKKNKHNYAREFLTKATWGERVNDFINDYTNRK